MQKQCIPFPYTDILNPRLKSGCKISELRVDLQSRSASISLTDNTENVPATVPRSKGGSLRAKDLFRLMSDIMFHENPQDPQKNGRLKMNKGLHDTGFENQKVNQK